MRPLPRRFLALRHFGVSRHFCMVLQGLLSSSGTNPKYAMHKTLVTRGKLSEPGNRFRSMWPLNRPSGPNPSPPSLATRKTKQRRRALPRHVPAPPCPWGAVSPVSCAGSRVGCFPQWARSDPRPLLRPRPSPAAAGSTRNPRSPGRRRAATLLSRPISSARPAREGTVSEVEQGSK